MGALRWCSLAGAAVSVAVGVWFWRYLELAEAGRIPISPEPSGDGEHPVGTYTAGVVVCGVIACLCVVLVLVSFVPERRRSTASAAREPRRTWARPPRRIRPGGSAGPLPSGRAGERRGLRRPEPGD